MSAGHGHGAGHGDDHGGGVGKRLGLVIAVLAALLAIVETGAKSANYHAIEKNVEAANLWAFFQAKTIRRTTIDTAAQSFEAMIAAKMAPAEAEPLRKQIDAWKRTSARYESEPETNEGRKELMARAQGAEAAQKTYLAAYHLFEYASAAFQLAIVLVSVAIIRYMGALVIGGALLGIAGVALGLLGWLAPTALHL